MRDETTVTWNPEPPPDDAPGTRLAFVLVGCVHEPERVGEVLFLPSPDDGPADLGRHGTLGWMRQRPGARTPTGPLGDRTLSRRQLRLEPGPNGVTVRNIGRLPLRLDGRPATAGVLRPGCLVEIGDRVSFLVVERPEFVCAGGTPAATELGRAGGTPAPTEFGRAGGTPAPTGFDPSDRIDEGHRFGHPDACGLVGESAAAWELRRQVRFAAARSAHVLVLGESGTGKELVARGLHQRSDRRRCPFVSRNAATIPESLADAELFGNIPGYPNPGMPGRPGLVGEADGGVLFLDEFGELPAEVQARLLRVLDSGEYTRLGEARQRRASLRLVAATNRDPGQLKHDVVARFALRVEVPPLSARIEDIPLIAFHLLRRVAEADREIAARFFPGGDPRGCPRVSLRLLHHLLAHRYTAHVREIEAMLWHAIGCATGDVVDLWPEERPPPAAAPRLPGRSVDPATLSPEVIQEVLDRHAGRQEATRRELGLSSRHVLARLVKKYGLVVRSRDWSGDEQR